MHLRGKCKWCDQFGKPLKELVTSSVHISSHDTIVLFLDFDLREIQLVFPDSLTNLVPNVYGSLFTITLNERKPNVLQLEVDKHIYIPRRPF